MVQGLKSEAGRRGFWTRSEAYVGCGFADLIIGKGNRFIVVEVECTPARLARDLSKARSIHATDLWIVVPDSTKRHRYRRRFPSNSESGMRVLVLSYPQTVKALTEIGGYLDRDE